FSGFPSVQKWLARHHVMQKSLSSSYLEALLFHPEEKTTISYEHFSRLYSRIYDTSHLERDQQVYQKISNLPKLIQGELNRDEFVAVSLSLWNFEENPEPLVTILKDHVDYLDANDRLSFADHVQLLERAVSRKEQTIEEEEDGVIFTTISSGHTLDVTHKIYIGLLKENFQRKIPPFISLRDIQALQRDLGFNMENPEEEKSSQELLLQKNEDL
ncbi:MAG: hypothetical protein V4736_14055, partial [Bdellovibrionota bacterium]